MEVITIFEESAGVFKWRIMNGTNVVDESSTSFSEYGLAAADAFSFYNLTVQ